MIIDVAPRQRVSRTLTLVLLREDAPSNRRLGGGLPLAHVSLETGCPS